MDILSKIKPSKEEKIFIEKTTKEFLNKLKKIKSFKPIIGGSISKDTWLSGTKEVDVFAAFNYNKFKEKNISDVLNKELKKVFKIKKVHGSRDYFHILFNGVIFEVVPILDIKKPEQALNVTDLSPLHIKFVRKFSKLKDEIRILKSFCKSNYLYGAESYISGFSGYALEVLVIYYGSFKNVLKNSLKWKEKTVLDFYKKLKNPLFELNPSKTISPLILIDPVDKNRNLTSSLSLEKFNKFKELAKEYLKKPSEEFFILKKEIPKEAFVLKIKPVKGKIDIINSKIVKATEFMLNELNKNEFHLLKKDIFWGEEVIFWFTLKEKLLDEELIKKGPPENFEKNVSEFKKKYKKVFLKDGIYYSKVKRKYVKVEDLLKDLLNSEYVKERVKEINTIDKC